MSAKGKKMTRGDHIATATSNKRGFNGRIVGGVQRSWKELSIKTSKGGGGGSYDGCSGGARLEENPPHVCRHVK